MEVISNNEKTAIEFGKLNEFIGKRYASITGAGNQSEIILADEALFKASAKPVEDFRDKNPIQFSDSELKQVAAEWNGVRMVVLQEGTEWNIKEPVQAPADFSAVIEIVREIRGFKAAEFIDTAPDLSAYNLNAPQMKVEFTFQTDRKPLTVLASAGTAPKAGDKNSAAKQPMFFSIGGKTIYKSADNALPKIIKPLRDFRQRQLFTFETDTVTKLEIVESGGNSSKAPMVMEHVGTSWKVNGQDGDAVFILQLINDIAVIEAADFPDSAQKDFGFQSPQRRFILTMKDRDGKVSTRELTIGKSANMPGGGKGYFAQDSAHPDAPFMLAEAVVQKLAPKLETLRRSAATPAPL